MEKLEGIRDGVAALKAYGEETESLSTELREAIAKATSHPSPVMAAVEGFEIMYANREELDAEGHEISAQLADFCADHHLGMSGVDDRGKKIKEAHLREAGIKIKGEKWPDKRKDPEARQEHKVGKG